MCRFGTWVVKYRQIGQQASCHFPLTKLENLDRGLLGLPAWELASHFWSQ
jgi:hypothetical protein